MTEPTTVPQSSTTVKDLWAHFRGCEYALRYYAEALMGIVEGDGISLEATVPVPPIDLEWIMMRFPPVPCIPPRCIIGPRGFRSEVQTLAARVTALSHIVDGLYADMEARGKATEEYRFNPSVSAPFEP